MDNGLVAYIFPAFINELSGNELDFLSQHGVNLKDYLDIATKIIGNDYTCEMLNYEEIFKDELRPQVFSYCFGCALSDVYLKKLPVPGAVAGYSMGIYAALYAMKAISFEDGLRMILKAYEIMSGLLDQDRYTMGTIVGLEIDDIDKLIEQYPNVEIINRNNSHSFVLAGEKSHIVGMIDEAKEEGALSAHVLKVSIPYHSKYLQGADELFGKLLDTLEIKDSMAGIVSLVDQKIILKSDDIKTELKRNLIKPLDWHQTMQLMIDMGFDIFYECGAGRELYKIGRFIKGDFKIYTMDKMKKVIG